MKMTFTALPAALAIGVLVQVATLPTAHAGKAHEHGVAKLDVAVDGNMLTVALQSPLDNLLGFERAPRTDAERKAAAALLVRLRSDGALFKADAAAQCTLKKAEVTAPVLDASSNAPTGDHADLDATFEYTCAQPQQLRTLDLGLFDAFRRMQRIEVQVASAKGQSKLTLRRPARTVTLAR